MLSLFSVQGIYVRILQDQPMLQILFIFPKMIMPQCKGAHLFLENLKQMEL